MKTICCAALVTAVAVSHTQRLADRNPSEEKKVEDKKDIGGFGKNSGNSRNGKSRKTLKGKQGEIPIEVPRDSNGEFDPQFVKKRQTRFDGFDDKIISLYARRMTVSFRRAIWIFIIIGSRQIVESSR